MNKFIVEEKLKQFFIEDQPYLDLTSDLIFPKEEIGKANFIVKESGIISGLHLIEEGYRLLDDSIVVRYDKKDGDRVEAGERLATVKGPMASILKGERVILNLLQRMSGIATVTKEAILRLNNPNIQIIDTRKTTPGLRIFDKYAVTCGGGVNHRFSLSDLVMIKDNHIAFSGSIEKAVERVRQQLGPAVKIEVETENLDQVKEAVAQQVDIIMFDNCTVDEINQMAPYVPETILTEASGGITLENISEYREAKVNFISLGFLTHSVKALDISLMIEGVDN